MPIPDLSGNNPPLLVAVNSAKRGSLTVAAPIGTAVPVAASDFNVTIGGTWTGSIVPERSFNGITWHPVTYIDGTPVVWTNNISVSMGEDEHDVLWRFNASSLNGTAFWRISQ